MRCRSILLIPAVLGCAGAPAAPAGAKRGALGDSDAPAGVSAARWEYHPPAPDPIVSQLRLADGTCILGTDGGQRWSVSGARGAVKTRPCAGRGEAARTLAPEAIVAIVRHGASSWFFAGASGTLYESTEPLGSFARTVPAPEPLSRIAGAGTILLGVTLDGRLLRWEEGVGWRPGAPVAPPPARVFDIAVADGGFALAVTAPEALFASNDGGVTWRPLSAPLIGARRLGFTAAGALAAEGLLETEVWSPRDNPALSAIGEALPSPPAESEVTVGPAPRAAAIFGGRAVLFGDRYVELVRPDGEREDDAWSMLYGRIDERLRERPVPESRGCETVHVGAYGKRTFLGCVRAVGNDAALELRRSESADAPFGPPLTLPTPDPENVTIAVGPDGSALVTGACRSGSATCQPGPPIVVRVDDGRLTASVAVARELGGAATAPAFAPDGRSAYFLGRRGKDRQIGLFVSHDGGETFVARSIDRATTKLDASKPGRPDERGRPPSPPPPIDDDDDDESNGTLELDDMTAIRPGEDATVGITITRAGAPGYVLTDDDGRLLTVASPPVRGAILSGTGRRVLALGTEGDEPVSEHPAMHVWESLDGGATWSDMLVPPTLLREFTQSAPAVACGSGGCLVGDTMTRVGWSGPDAPIAPRPVDTDAQGEPAVRTPIVCELTRGGRWARFDHVEGLGPTTSALRGIPDANQAMRGRIAWSLLQVERDSGSVTAVSVPVSDSSQGEVRFVAKSLLGKPSAPGRMALDVSHQMEGYAAVRVRLPGSGKDAAPVGPMRNVEVAWENYMDGTSGRVTIPDAGAFEPGDVKREGEQNQLNGALLSVSPGGIFVRPHSFGARSPLTFLLDTRGPIEHFDYPAWPTRALGRTLDVRGDLALVDRQPVAVGLVREGNQKSSSVLLAHRPPRPPSPGAQPDAKAGRFDPRSGWVIGATTLAPPADDDGPLVTMIEWTYSGSSVIGLTNVVVDPKRARAWASFHPFRADGTFGPARPVPTLLDLGMTPRPCSVTERAATPRVEAPLFIAGRNDPLLVGVRHPVLLDDVVLLTASAIVHGTPASPCVAAWDASGAAGAPVGAILSGDLAHAWLFRRAESREPTPKRAASEPAEPRRETGPSAGTTIEVRAMSCRFDPGAKVPESVWHEAGTVRTLR